MKHWHRISTITVGFWISYPGVYENSRVSYIHSQGMYVNCKLEPTRTWLLSLREWMIMETRFLTHGNGGLWLNTICPVLLSIQGFSQWNTSARNAWKRFYYMSPKRGTSLSKMTVNFAVLLAWSYDGLLLGIGEWLLLIVREKRDYWFFVIFVHRCCLSEYFASMIFLFLMAIYFDLNDSAPILQWRDTRS